MLWNHREGGRLHVLPEGEKGPSVGYGLSSGQGKDLLILREAEKIVFVFSYFFRLICMTNLFAVEE